jgi:hypothetical protein
MTIKRLRRNGWALLGTVESDTDRNVEYEIKRNPVDGSLGCACMGWAFSSVPKTCRHLRAWNIGSAVFTPAFATPQVVRGAAAPSSRVTLEKEAFTVRRAIALDGLD